MRKAVGRVAIAAVFAAFAAFGREASLFPGCGLFSFFRADWYSGRNWSNGLTPEKMIAAHNAVQRYAVENTRLGIPLEICGCQFLGETDELFRSNGFKHVRGGLLDVTPYDPKGEKRAGLRPVHTVDEAFIPAKELRNRFRLDTALVGESYNTDIEDILKCVRRCAERNEVFVLTSHGIAPGAKSINMKTEWLERILATAKECGVAVIGFDEL